VSKIGGLAVCGLILAACESTRAPRLMRLLNQQPVLKIANDYTELSAIGAAAG